MCLVGEQLIKTNLVSKSKCLKMLFPCVHDCACVCRQECVRTHRLDGPGEVRRLEPCSSAGRDMWWKTCLAPAPSLVCTALGMAEV